MKLNLCEIIEMPGSVAPFSCEVSTERLGCPSILSFVSPPTAKGEIRNNADALTLLGELKAELVCVCDRCGKEFKLEKIIPLEVKLAAELTDEDNPEVYPIVDNELDLSDLLETCFILETDAKFLCREDCEGLCPRCGKDLNLGPCGCGKEIDPRLAVLGQLLDKKD